MSNETEVFTPKHFLQVLNTGKIFEVTKPMVAGRKDQEINLSYTKVSSTHFEVMPKGISLFIRDLQSTNGTYVNKVKIGTDLLPLASGDEIQIGELRILYSSVRPEKVRATEDHFEDMSFSEQLKEIIHVSYGRVFAYLIFIAFVGWAIQLSRHDAKPLPADLAFLEVLRLQDISTSASWVVYAVALLGPLLIHLYASRKWVSNYTFPKAGQLLRSFFLIGVFFVSVLMVIIHDINLKKNHERVKQFIRARQYLLRTKADKNADLEFKWYEREYNRLRLQTEEGTETRTQLQKLHDEDVKTFLSKQPNPESFKAILTP